MSQAMTYIEQNQRKFVEDLLQLIRIPSVSAVPGHAGDVRHCAEWLADHLNRVGMAARVEATGGHPLVYAEWVNAPGAPTVLIYGHYDVQPPEPLELWRHPPFEGVIEGDNLIARGATDDKGQMFAHVKAIESYFRTGGKLPVNVKMVVEGEEETGSENLDHWISANRERLRCDAIVVSDGSQFAPGIPAITYGLRGLAYFELRVDGPNKDLHSGAYGGAVANPANALGEIIAGLKDAGGHITIEGFYDRVRPVSAEERAELARLPGEDDDEFCRSLGLTRAVGEQGFSTLERKWIRPTCDVNGIYGGYEGEGSKTVLPAWAGAKVSFRLVPDQDPAEIGRLFIRHVETHTPAGVRVQVTQLHGGNPVLVPADGPAMKAARRAVARGFGREPVLIRDGGSIPVVSTFLHVLGVPTLLIGFGLNDDNTHSPNEKFSLTDYQRGIRTSAALLEELATLGG